MTQRPQWWGCCCCFIARWGGSNHTFLSVSVSYSRFSLAPGFMLLSHLNSGSANLYKHPQCSTPPSLSSSPFMTGTITATDSTESTSALKTVMHLLRCLSFVFYSPLLLCLSEVQPPNPEQALTRWPKKLFRQAPFFNLWEFALCNEGKRRTEG